MLLGTKFRNLISICKKNLIEHASLFSSVEQQSAYNTFSILEAESYLKYILRLINLEEDKNRHIENKQIFKGANDKLKEAGISFGNGDYDATMNNLNTCMELALKDKLDIPTTISKISTNKIIDICIAENIGLVEYLKEIKKHILLDSELPHSKLWGIEIGIILPQQAAGY